MINTFTVFFPYFQALCFSIFSSIMFYFIHSFYSIFVVLEEKYDNIDWNPILPVSLYLVGINISKDQQMWTVRHDTSQHNYGQWWFCSTHSTFCLLRHLFWAVHVQIWHQDVFRLEQHKAKAFIIFCCCFSFSGTLAQFWM